MQQVTNIKEIEIAVKQNKEIVVSKIDNKITIMNMEEYRKKCIKEDMVKALKKSEKEIENGKVIDSDAAFKELKQKYGY